MVYLLTSHGTEILIIVTNVVLGHVTWRTIPEDRRHSFRRAIRATVRLRARERHTGAHRAR